MTHAVEPYLEDISKVVSYIWRSKSVVRMVLGTLEDSQQQAILYCLHYGLRYWDKEYPLAIYFKQLARRGIWQSVEKYRYRISNNLPIVTYQKLLESCKYEDFTLKVINKLDTKHLLKLMTVREAEVISLKYGIDNNGEEKSYEEVSQHLGIATGTVRKTLENAKKRVRNTYKG